MTVQLAVEWVSRFRGIRSLDVTAGNPGPNSGRPARCNCGGTDHRRPQRFSSWPTRTSTPHDRAILAI